MTDLLIDVGLVVTLTVIAIHTYNLIRDIIRS
jgi:hypothetical protein